MTSTRSGSRIRPYCPCGITKLLSENIDMLLPADAVRVAQMEEGSARVLFEHLASLQRGEAIDGEA